MGGLGHRKGESNWILAAGTTGDDLVDGNPTNSFSGFYRTCWMDCTDPGRDRNEITAVKIAAKKVIE